MDLRQTIRPVAIVACMLAVTPLAIAETTDETEADLRLHLPRTRSVEVQKLRLETVVLVQAEDDQLEAKAAAIAMGRAPWSGEQLVIDRKTILGRLAANGIDPDRVKLTGADEVTVTRDEQLIAAADLVAAAETFLERSRPGPEGVAWQRISEPAKMVIPAGGKVELEPRFVPHEVKGQTRVEVAAMRDGKKVGAEHVVFRLAYPKRTLVTTRALARGEAVTPENTKVVTEMDTRPQPPTWAPKYGYVAVQPIPAGATIRTGQVRVPKPKLLVRRRQSVVMKIVGDGYKITAMGEALEDGHEGDYIKVRNIDSKRVVVAKVNYDGSVEPVFNRNPGGEAK